MASAPSIPNPLASLPSLPSLPALPSLPSSLPSLSSIPNPLQALSSLGKGQPIKLDDKIKKELDEAKEGAYKISDIYRQTPLFQFLDDKSRCKEMVGRLIRKALYEITGDFENLTKKKPHGANTGRPWLADAAKRPAWMTVAKAAYYLRYPSATYGTWYFIGDHYPAGPRQLLIDAWRTVQFALWRTKTITAQPKVIVDNILSLNALTIILRTGIPPSDLIYVSYSDRISETCFYVALDSVAKTIVVAIRGTDSAEDAITDLLGYPAEFTELKAKIPTAQAHGGILNAARFVVNKLKSEKVLETAFKRAPDYQLLVVGHSLGAGTASLTSILLHESGYPNVTCFAYEPPGWMVTKEVADYAKSFVLSIIHGDDMVPRISLHALQNINSKAASASKIVGLLSKLPADSNLNWANARLVVPGQILYLEKVVQGGIITETVYDPRSADPESFEGVVVTSQFLHDHLEDKVQDALNYAVNRLASQFS